jgi:acetoin utilization deacetylase AcuC-like enzyme
MVAGHIRGLSCKTVIVMAGGYGDYETIASMHVATIEAFAGVASIRS